MKNARHPLAILACLVGVVLAALALADSTPEPPLELRWSDGQVAAGTAATLAPQEPVTVQIPRELAQKIHGPTVLFYFSPTCPHCIEAMKEVGPMARSGDLNWIGISVGGASEFEVDQFRRTHGDPFEIWADTDHAFATAVGARSTPNVYIVAPSSDLESIQTDPSDEDEDGSRRRRGRRKQPTDADTTSHKSQTQGADQSHDLVPVLVTGAVLPYGRGMGPILALRTHLDDPFGQMEGYQGDLLCGQCHVEEARSWALTHHSIAYRTLYMRDKAEDTECVGCHVTGLGEPGGFEIGDHGSPMSGVGCESCHGPSGPHDGTPTDAIATCEGCHDAEHSVFFDVARAIPHIDHYRASSMTDVELNEALMALLNGEAERPLLAFPEGPTVGASQCESCHESQHRWLQSDPHSQAMETLGTDASNPECIRCHATAARYDSSVSAMSTTERSIEDYRIEEGVGCESCHGSGEAHIKAPSKSNILGLGESCPECIIEGICTSCHTPKWDMKWDLQTRLDAIPH